MASRTESEIFPEDVRDFFVADHMFRIANHDSPAAAGNDRPEFHVHPGGILDRKFPGEVVISNHANAFRTPMEFIGIF